MKTRCCKKTGVHAVMILAGMVPVGCSSEDQRARDCLVGKWEWEHADLIEGVFSGEINFYADGKYYQTFKGGDIVATAITYIAGRSFVGRWAVENGELIVSRDSNSDSKGVRIFSIDNSGSGEPVKIKL